MFKKLTSAILALVLTFSFSISAFAKPGSMFGEDAVVKTKDEIRAEKEAKNEARKDNYLNGGKPGDFMDRLINEVWDKAELPKEYKDKAKATAEKAVDEMVDFIGKNNEIIKEFFEKWYSNNIRVVHLKNITEPTQITVKLDFSDMKTDNLKFYVYDIDNNKVYLIEKPEYTFDKDGNLTFSANVNGFVVISENELKLK